MFKLFTTICLFIAAGCSLAGCATLQNVGQRACDNRSLVLTALEMAYDQTASIVDETARTSTRVALNTAIAALKECPANGN